MSYLDARLVPPELILEAMTECPLELVTKAEMKELVPNLSDEQAEELMGCTEQLEEIADNECLGLSDTLKLTVTVRESVHNMVDTVDEIYKLEQEENVIDQHKKPILHPTSERQLKSLEKRVASLEAFLNEGMSYLVLRGKEMRTRLDVMEKKLQAMKAQQERAEAPEAAEHAWTRLRGAGGVGSRV